MATTKWWNNDGAYTQNSQWATKTHQNMECDCSCGSTYFNWVESSDDFNAKRTISLFCSRCEKCAEVEITGRPYSLVDLYNIRYHASQELALLFSPVLQARKCRAEIASLIPEKEEQKRSNSL